MQKVFSNDEYFAACERDFTNQRFYEKVLAFNYGDVLNRPLSPPSTDMRVSGGEPSSPVEDQIERLNEPEIFSYQRHLDAMDEAWKQYKKIGKSDKYISGLEEFYKGHAGEDAADIAASIPCDNSTLWRQRRKLMILYAQKVYPMWLITDRTDVKDEDDVEPHHCPECGEIVDVINGPVQKDERNIPYHPTCLEIKKHRDRKRN